MNYINLNFLNVYFLQNGTKGVDYHSGQTIIGSHTGSLDRQKQRANQQRNQVTDSDAKQIIKQCLKDFLDKHPNASVGQILTGSSDNVLKRFGNMKHILAVVEQNGDTDTVLKLKKYFKYHHRNAKRTIKLKVAGVIAGIIGVGSLGAGVGIIAPKLHTLLDATAYGSQEIASSGLMAPPVIYTDGIEALSNAATDASKKFSEAFNELESAKQAAIEAKSDLIKQSQDIAGMQTAGAPESVIQEQQDKLTELQNASDVADQQVEAAQTTCDTLQESMMDTSQAAISADATAATEASAAATDVMQTGMNTVVPLVAVGAGLLLITGIGIAIYTLVKKNEKGSVATFESALNEIKDEYKQAQQEQQNGSNPNAIKDFEEHIKNYDPQNFAERLSRQGSGSFKQVN